MRLLEPLELAEQGVVLGVGYFRGVVPVIPVVVIPEEPAQFLGAALGGSFAHPAPDAAPYSSSSAAIPGRCFPSSSSRKAPPPVETYDIPGEEPRL